MPLLPTLLPKGVPAAPTLLEFAEPPAALKLSLNLLPAEAAPALEVAPALASPSALSLAAPLALAPLIVLATPQPTADEDAILKRLKLEEKFLQPAEAPQLIEPLRYPFRGGQTDKIQYGIIYEVCSKYAFDGCEIRYQEAWGAIGGIEISRPANTPTKPGNNYAVNPRILCHDTLPFSYKTEQFWKTVGVFGEVPESPATARIISITRLDGQPDATYPPPLNQPIYSQHGQTLSSPDPYQRTIGDRPSPAPVPHPLLTPNPAPTPKLDFAEPQPKLKLGVNLTPAPLSEPDRQPFIVPSPSSLSDPAPLTNSRQTPAPAPAPNPTTLYGPSSDPGTTKIIFPAPSSLPTPLATFTPNPQNRLPEPQLQPLARPQVDPKPEPTDLERIRQNTEPEILKKAAADGTCQTLQPNGCMAPLVKNAETAANNSASNSNKLDRLNAGLNALNSTVWIPIQVPIVVCEANSGGGYSPRRSYTSVQVETTPTGSEAQQVLTQFEEIAKASESACLARNKEKVALGIPEHWAIIPGSDRPQLVIIFATKSQTSGKWGGSRWQMAIPHPNFRAKQLHRLSIDSKQQGEFHAYAELKDNSKIRVYMNSEIEARNYLAKIISNYVDKDYWPSVNIKDFIKSGIRKGIKSQIIHPYKAELYLKGIEGAGQPDEEHYF